MLGCPQNGPCLKFQFDTDSRPDDPVNREPVSVPNSVPTGKNTGKFTKLALCGKPLSSGCALLLGTFIGSPQEPEQGICKDRTGKIDSRSGNPSMPSLTSLYVRFLDLSGRFEI